MDTCQAKYEFGEFLLDPRERQLLHAGQAVPLTPKAFDLLVLLVKNSGGLLTKDELMSALWPDSFVEEINLAQNISLIRKALGDSSREERVVETVPKQGYRFKAKVREIPARPMAEVAGAPAKTMPEPRAPLESLASAAEAAQTSPGDPCVTNMPKSSLPLISLIAVCVAVAGMLVVVWLGSAWWRRRAVAAHPSAPRSLAVLPLVNLSGDAGQDFFADGMTDELTTQLAKIGSVRIVSRTSAMRYRNPQKPLPQIARELNVDAVIEGSVVRSDERVKLTVQLIDGATDRHVWADSYECDRKEALSLPKQVALDIAHEFKGTMNALGQRPPGSRPVDPGAYEAFFKARYFWNKRTEPDLKKARAYFQEAMEKDPAYAPAYAGLALWYISASSYSLISPQEAYPLSRAMAQKALALDGALAEAHVPLGVIQSEYEWNLPAAEKEFREAIALNPNDVTAHQFYAEDVLEAEGRSVEAIAELRLAEQLDPSSVMTRVAVGYGFFLARDYGQALEQARKTLELEPSFPKAHQILGYAYEGKGMVPEAIGEFEMATRLDTNPAYSFALAHAYALSGRKQEAEREISKLTATSLQHQHYVHPYSVALVYVAMGEKNKALDWLERARKERCWMVIYLKVDPRMDSLRTDARFKALLQQVRYSE